MNLRPFLIWVFLPGPKSSNSVKPESNPKKAPKMEDLGTQIWVHFQSKLFWPNPIKSKPDAGWLESGQEVRFASYTWTQHTQSIGPVTGLNPIDME